MRNEATKKVWPYEFTARMTLTVGTSLQLEMETTNRDKAGPAGLRSTAFVFLYR